MESTQASPVPEKRDEVVSVSRSTVYFVVTAVAFFIIGYVVAWFSFTQAVQAQNSELEQTVQRAVSAALAETGGAVAAAPQPTPLPAVVDNVSVDDDPALGPADAPITIVEFSDFRCPYCGRFFEQTLSPLMEQYEGQVRLVYRDFPVVGGGTEGRRAAAAAECADDQGQFWAYHDALFANQSDLTEEALIRYAGEIEGIDVAAFTTCVEAETYVEEVQSDLRDGVNYGVSGTPTFFINGRRLVGAQPIESFQALVDEALADAG